MILIPILLVACDMAEMGEMFGMGDSHVTQAEQIEVFEQKPKEEIKEEEATEEYVYHSNNKRDPFQSFLRMGVEEENTLSLTPLQKYEVGQYHLVGIIWDVDRPRAMVEDPDGQGHVMELGTYIGTRWGKVEIIEEGVVVVTEERHTVDGRLEVHKQEMQLERPYESIKTQ